MPTLHLNPIDRTLKTPLYTQIAEQIRMQISEGRLPIGTQLPTVRELAQLLGVTRLTAQSAYRELQSGGWIESTVGRGTFVCASTDTAAVRALAFHDTSPDHVMRDISRIARLAGLRSMAYAEPDPAHFPMSEFMRFFMHPVAQDSILTQYGSPQGDEMLRVELIPLLQVRGVSATPEDVIVTNGVMQGLSLAISAIARPGDTAIIEKPTYLGVLHVLSTLGVIPIALLMDEEGLMLDRLEDTIRTYRPRFIYTIPTFQNPTGALMSLARRQALVDLARRYDTIILEDDIYGLLAFDEKPPTSLFGLDQALGGGGNVIYLSSLSKILMPGLRIGYLVAPPELQESILARRQASDLSGPPLLQRAAAHFLHRGKLKAHLERVNVKYRERRDELLRVMAQKMPAYARWTKPKGGFCTWVTLPSDCVPRDLHHLALTHGVAYTPGESFLTEPDGFVHLRLCFGGLSPELIRESVTILARLLDPTLARPPSRLRTSGDERPIV